MNERVKKAVRIMNFADNRTYSKALFSKIGLLNFENLYELEAAKLMYDANSNSITSTICNLFKKTKAIHPYKTRQATAYQFSFPLVSTECRNRIPQEIRSLSRKKLFNKKVRKWLLQQY